MSARSSSISFSPPWRKDSTTKHSSKLKSWFTHLRSPASASSSRSPHVQIQSNLLSTLPVEIRCQIYGYVLNSYGTVQHICLLSDKLAHMRCTAPASHTYFQDFNARHNNDCDPYNDDFRKSTQNGWEVVPLLLSCRKIYIEFVDLLYSTTTFRFTTHAAPRLIATVPSAHLVLARLHISFLVSYPIYLPYVEWHPTFTRVYTYRVKTEEADWEAFWQALSRVRVRAIVVEIIDHGIRVPEETLLKPLREVSAEIFEVVLPWPTNLETSGEFGDAGFTVRRPPEGVDIMMQISVDYGCSQVQNRRGIWGRLRKR